MQNEDFTSEEILSKIIERAITKNASDIHFDPGKGKTSIQYRIDGLLQLKDQIDNEKYWEILSKIKIECHLRIDDHFTPKDGSFSLNIHENETFFRVSTIPSRYGESVVLRLLKKSDNYSLSDLGIEESDRQMILFSLSKRGSIGIVMGPTGSGKTTTLYALLNELKSDDVMAVTLEDPVEVWIEGVRQIEVKKESLINFSNALRSTLRQDPDIILIGEIRDYDSAILAFQAALTGHIVITSIHAYDISHLIPRLLSLGLPDYLIKGLEIVSINQRLLASLCNSCKQKIKPNADYLEIECSFESKGCEDCNHTGIGGRILAYEIGGEKKKLKDRVLNLVLTSQVSLKVAESYLQ